MILNWQSNLFRLCRPTIWRSLLVPCAIWSISSFRDILWRISKFRWRRRRGFAIIPVIRKAGARISAAASCGLTVSKAYFSAFCVSCLFPIVRTNSARIGGITIWRGRRVNISSKKGWNIFGLRIALKISRGNNRGKSWLLLTIWRPFSITGTFSKAITSAPGKQFLTRWGKAMPTRKRYLPNASVLTRNCKTMPDATAKNICCFYMLLCVKVWRHIKS